MPSSSPWFYGIFMNRVCWFTMVFLKSRIIVFSIFSIQMKIVAKISV